MLSKQLSSCSSGTGLAHAKVVLRGTSLAQDLSLPRLCIILQQSSTSRLHFSQKYNQPIPHFRLGSQHSRPVSSIKQRYSVQHTLFPQASEIERCKGVALRRGVCEQEQKYEQQYHHLPRQRWHTHLTAEAKTVMRVTAATTAVPVAGPAVERCVPIGNSRRGVALRKTSTT